MRKLMLLVTVAVLLLTGGSTVYAQEDLWPQYVATLEEAGISGLSAEAGVSYEDVFLTPYAPVPPEPAQLAQDVANVLFMDAQATLAEVTLFKTLFVGDRAIFPGAAMTMPDGTVSAVVHRLDGTEIRIEFHPDGSVSVSVILPNGEKAKITLVFNSDGTVTVITYDGETKLKPGQSRTWIWSIGVDGYLVEIRMTVKVNDDGSVTVNITLTWYGSK